MFFASQVYESGISRLAIGAVSPFYFIFLSLLILHFFQRLTVDVIGKDKSLLQIVAFSNSILRPCLQSQSKDVYYIV